MKVLLLIGSGSFIGGVARYLISQLVQNRNPGSFPYGTLVVNIAGCFLIGLLLGLIEKGHVPAEWKFFLATGILGGFTTFSAFSHESFGMMQNGQHTYAMLYITISIAAGLLATFLGFLTLKLF
ncbi:MAG: fluoride efflux transporter CrcB [Bacteroidota bacterium]